MAELRGYTDEQNIYNNFFLTDLSYLVLADKYQSMEMNLSGSLLFKRYYNGTAYYEIVDREYGEYDNYVNLWTTQFFDLNDFLNYVRGMRFPNFTEQEIIDLLNDA